MTKTLSSARRAISSPRSVRRFVVPRNGIGAVAAALGISFLCASTGQAAEATAAPGDGSRFGLASKPLAPEMKELYDYKGIALSLQDATFEAQVAVHRAHTVMLAEEGIISRNEAAAILKGLNKVKEMAGKNPALKAYLPYETALIKEVGTVAGKMHIGRSRNDLANTINRMYYRDEINRMTEALLALRKELVRKARENLETVMVVYTHRKQAQPVTLGHYLMAHAEALGKSIQRYEDLYRRTNLNPLGAAATAGTGFPLNRERTTQLLGFDGLVVNSIEGVAAWDHIAEFAADNSVYMATLARLASEMQNWQTDEFDMIDMDESFAGSSSIMPQKKNPTSLEYTKQAAAETLGDLVAVLASLDAIEYQHSVARVPLEPRAIDRVVAATHAMTGAIRTMTPKKERMAGLARDGFSTMTELTDTLVRESGLSFREAHDIIAHVVQAAIEAHKTPADIDVEMIETAAVKTLGRRINIAPTSIKTALDPMTNVTRRSGIGGPAPDAVQKAIDLTNQEIAGAEKRLGERRNSLEKADSALKTAEAGVIGTTATH